MDNEALKRYSLNVWYKMNCFLLVTTIIFTIIFFALFIACFIKRIPDDFHNFILEMCGVFASLSSAF